MLSRWANPISRRIFSFSKIKSSLFLINLSRRLIHSIQNLPRPQITLQNSKSESSVTQIRFFVFTHSNEVNEHIVTTYWTKRTSNRSMCLQQFTKSQILIATEFLQSVFFVWSQKDVSLISAEAIFLL